MNNFKALLTYYCIVFFFIALAVLGFYFYSLNYNELVSGILETIQRTDLKHKIETTFFTQSKFNLAKHIAISVSSLSILVLVPLIRLKLSIVSKINTTIIHFNAFLLPFLRPIEFKNKSAKIAYSLFLIILCVRFIYMNYYYPIQYDEAWNFNYFIKSKLYYTLFAYNNYPLHNIFTWLFVSIFGHSLLILRLTSFLAGMLCVNLIYKFIKINFGSDSLALCVSIVFSLLPVNTYYSLLSRGVELEILFALIVTFSLYKTISAPNTKHQWLLIGCINGLGTFSMLSHVYFIAFSVPPLLALLFLKNNHASLRGIILYILASGFVSILMISPILLGTGFELGISAATSGKSYLALHFAPFHSYSIFITGSQYLFYILLILNTSLLVIYFKSNKVFLPILNLSFLVSIFVIRFCTGIFPPERALSFLSIVPITTLFLMLLSIQRNHRFIVTLAYCVYLVYATFSLDYINWSRMLDIRVKEVAQNLIKNNVTTIHNNQLQSNYFSPGLEYYYYLSNKNIHYTTSVKSSTRYLDHPDLMTIDCFIDDLTPSNDFHILDSIEDSKFYIRNIKK